MTIDSISGTSAQAGQMGMNQATDSYSRNIQNQISNAQKQLQELSSNEDMALEEKMKKRQEIQQKISDLNMQLRQHQMEQRRQKQQPKDSSMDNKPGSAKNAGSRSTGLSQESMTAMISAGSSIKQAKVQGSVATQMKGQAGVLKSEIKQDAGRGASVEKKKAELADIEQKAQTASASEISTLADANRTMEEAAKADSEEKETDIKDTKTADAKEKDSEGNVSNADETTVTSQQPSEYTSVDVRL